MAESKEAQGKKSGRNERLGLFPSRSSNNRQPRGPTMTSLSLPLFAFLPNIGMQEMIILLIIGVLLFGRKLPEVGRYLGKGIVEFKKGIKGLEDEFENAGTPAPTQAPQALDQPRPPQRVMTTAPKFEDNVAPAPGVTPPPKA
jgi:sec-independent protein translocase protein TatA